MEIVFGLRTICNSERMGPEKGDFQHPSGREEQGGQGVDRSARDERTGRERGQNEREDRTRERTKRERGQDEREDRTRERTGRERGPDEREGRTRGLF